MNIFKVGDWVKLTNTIDCSIFILQVTDIYKGYMRPFTAELKYISSEKRKHEVGKRSRWELREDDDVDILTENEAMVEMI